MVRSRITRSAYPWDRCCGALGACSSPGAEPVLLELGEHFGERPETTTEAVELVAALEAVPAPAPLPGPAAWKISEPDCMANA
jgi:hypothetical protein